jgi:hypothetical protein
MSGYPVADSAPTIGNEMRTGIYIGGSHMRSLDFSAAVIKFAAGMGFQTDTDQLTADVWQMDQGLLTSEEEAHMSEEIDWEYERALGFLNDSLGRNDERYWEVYEPSLYLSEEGNGND